MQKWRDLRKELLKDSEVKKEYDRLAPGYKVISQIIEARVKKGLSQAELAKRAGLKQSAIARMESGRANPTLGFLEKVTNAMDMTIKIGYK